jgi:hypothetical protein
MLPGQMSDDVLKLSILGFHGELANFIDLALGYPASGEAYIGLTLVSQYSRREGLREGP